jgi:hypothetical protein
MILQKRSQKLQSAFRRQQDRLVMPFTANPAWFLLPTGLVSLLLVYVSLETNPRIYSSAKPVQLSQEVRPSEGIWYSIAPSESGLRIVSDQGDYFDVSADSSPEELANLTAQIKIRMKSVLSDVALAKRLTNSSTFVVLSVDERLSYAHIRPMIYSLAAAGVTRYGFEGRILKN